MSEDQERHMMMCKNCACRTKLLKASNKNIKTTLRIARYMLILAERGDLEREDVGCGILYGILRDAAYKIRKAAELEKSAHEKRGEWS